MRQTWQTVFRFWISPSNSNRRSITAFSDVNYSLSASVFPVDQVRISRVWLFWQCESLSRCDLTMCVVSSLMNAKRRHSLSESSLLKMVRADMPRLNIVKFIRDAWMTLTAHRKPCAQQPFALTTLNSAIPRSICVCCTVSTLRPVPSRNCHIESLLDYSPFRRPYPRVDSTSSVFGPLLIQPSKLKLSSFVTSSS